MSSHSQHDPSEVPGTSGTTPEDPFSEFDSPEPPSYTATPNFSRPLPRQSSIKESQSSPTVGSPPPPPSLPPVTASNTAALRRAYSTATRPLPPSLAPAPSTPINKNYRFPRISNYIPANTFSKHDWHKHGSPSSSRAHSSPRWCDNGFADDATMRSSSPSWTFDVDDEKDDTPRPKSLSTSSLRSMANLEVCLQVICGCLGFMNTVGMNMAFGFFQSYYTEHIFPGQNRAAASIIGSTQIFMLFLCFAVGAPALQNTKHCRLLFIAGSFLTFLSLLVTSICDTWLRCFFAHGLVTGLAMGAVFTSLFVMLLGYFASNPGFVAGISAVGAGLGGVVYTLLPGLVAGRVGYAWTLRIIALVNLLSMIPVHIILREGPPHIPSSSSGVIRKGMFGDGPYLLMIAGIFFSTAGIYYGLYFILPFGIDVLSLDITSSTLPSVVMFSATITGSILLTFLNDLALVAISVLVPTSFLSALLLFLWIGVENMISLYLLASLYGFVAVGMVVHSLSLSAVFGFAKASQPTTPNANSPRPMIQYSLGRREGIALGVMALGSLAGAPIGALLMSVEGGGYLYGQLFSGISLVVGSGMFLAARIAKGER